MKVLEKFNDGWWRIYVDETNSIGLYPSNYLIEEATTINYNNNNNNNNSNNNENHHHTDLKVKHSFSNDRLMEQTGGSLQNSLSPKSFNDSSQLGQDLNNTKCESVSSNEKEIEYVRVIYAYEASHSSKPTDSNSSMHELSVGLNEILKLIEDDNECLDYDKSWIKVFNCQGVSGRIPSNCVQPILDHQLNDFVFIRQPTCIGMFPNNPWYFGNITRFETVILFNKFAKTGDFLVRDSDVIIYLNKKLENF